MEPLSHWLRQHVPADAAEAESLTQMRTWLAGLAAPFDRATPGAHFTGSAVVVSPDGKRVCLVHHRVLNRWLQPGGHAEEEDGRDLLHTALREAREETGLSVTPHPSAPLPLDVDAHRIPAQGAKPSHLHLDVRFLLQAMTDATPQVDARESVEVAYFDWSAALALPGDAGLRRLLTKARRWSQP